MLITKNGVIYNELTKSLIEGIISTVRSPFCIVERELTYNHEYNTTTLDEENEYYDYTSEYVDDITTEEVDKGTIKVVEFLSSIKEYDLIDRYNEFLVS